MSQHSHSIRLRGPWQVHVPETQETLAVVVPCTLADAGLTGRSGKVVFIRRFGKPSHLESGEVVKLLVENCYGVLELQLNDVTIQSGDSINQWLMERNQIQITIDATDDRFGITGEVYLRIDSPG